MSNINTGIHFITFGDQTKDIREAGERLTEQAKNSGWFDSLTCYHVEDLQRLSSSWFASHCDFINSNQRGFGYWIWKPFVILEALKTIPDGSILVYADAGYEISQGGKERFEQYIRLTIASDFLGFYLPGFTIGQWTKSEALSYFNIGLTDTIVGEDQIQSGLLFFKKSKENIQFLNQWVELCTTKNYELVNDLLSQQNTTDFVEHRHDQSLLTLLIKTHKLGHLLPVEDYHIKYFKKEQYPACYPFQCLRNKTGTSQLSKWTAI